MILRVHPCFAQPVPAPSSCSAAAAPEMFPVCCLNNYNSQLLKFFFPLRNLLSALSAGTGRDVPITAELRKWWAVLQRAPGLGHPHRGQWALCFDILPVPKPGETSWQLLCQQWKHHSVQGAGWFWCLPSSQSSVPSLLPWNIHLRTPPSPSTPPCGSSHQVFLTVQPGLCCWAAQPGQTVGFGAPSPLSGHRLCHEQLCVGHFPPGNHGGTFYPGNNCHSWQNNTCPLPNPLLGVPAQLSWARWDLLRNHWVPLVPGNNTPCLGITVLWGFFL